MCSPVRSLLRLTRLASACVTTFAMTSSVSAGELRQPIGITDGSELDGAGVRVLIIGGAIDYFHPALGGVIDGSRYVENDTSRIDDRDDSGPYFPTGVIADGYDFAGLDGRSPDPDPFVDGRDAGLGTALASILHEVAPAAHLSVYKITDGTGRVAPDALRAALAHAADPNGPDGDPATDDTPDIVLIDALAASLDPASLEPLIASVRDVGALVVVPAGDRGRTAFALDPLATLPETLAVASTWPPVSAPATLSVSQPVTLSGRFGALVGPADLGIAPPLDPIDAELALIDVNTRCEILSDPSSLFGRLALVTAPDCDLTAAVELAHAHGALGVLLGSLPGEVETWRPMGASTEAVLPIVILDGALADDLARSLAHGTRVTATLVGPLDGDLRLLDTVNTFSSRGPRARLGDQTRVTAGLAPDLAAPGHAIRVPVAGPEGAHDVRSSTALAAAHVAAAAALVAQAHPDLPADALGARLVTTARAAWAAHAPLAGANIEQGGAGVRAPLTFAGAGRIDVGAAAGGALVASPWAVDLGVVEVSGDLTLTSDLTLTNHGTIAERFDVGTILRDPADAAGGVTWSVSAREIVLEPGQSGVVTVTATIEPRLLRPWPLVPPGSEPSAFDVVSALTVAEVDGWIRFTSPSQEVRVPFWVLPRPTSSTALDGDVCLAPSDFALTFDNASSMRGRSELFTLVALDPDEPAFADPGDIGAVGARLTNESDGVVLQVAVTTHAASPSPDGVVVAVAIDLTRDGAYDRVLVSAPESFFTGGLTSDKNVSALLVPSAAGLVVLPPPFTGRFDIAETRHTVADLLAPSRILSTSLEALDFVGTSPIDLAVLVLGPGGARGDVVPDGLDLDDLATASLTFDPGCAYRFAADAMFVETSQPALLLEPPSCADSALTGVLALHLTDPAPTAFEIITPPTVADFTCDERVSELAEPDRCYVEPDFLPYVHGACDGAATVTSDPPGFTTGVKKATLTITDPWGNATTCRTSVTVEDRAPPRIDCGELVALSGDQALLPVSHTVSGEDSCGGLVEARVASWRCLYAKDGAITHDLSAECVVLLEDGPTMQVLSLGERANLFEWQIIATDQAGNEALGTCYAEVTRETVTASGNGTCAGGGASLLGLVGLALALARRRARRPTRIIR